MLAWSTILCLVLPNVAVGSLLQVPRGIAWGLGNRDTPLEGTRPDWGARAQRAHANLVENLVVFAALVLIAHVADRNNQWTALGAQLFFWGRVGHVITYVAGLVPWRTVVFGIAILGEWMIALQLLG